MKKQLLYALIFLIMGIGCSKKDKLQPVAGTDQADGSAFRKGGSIIGKIAPDPGPGVALMASRTGNGPKASVEGNVDNDGNFVFAGLPAGSYDISLSGHMRYLPLELKAVQVVDGRQTDAGRILLRPNPDNGKILGFVNPAQAASTVMAQCLEPFSTNVFAATIDPSTGRYDMQNMTPGKWAVFFRSNDGFKDPQVPIAILAARESADMGTIVFESAPIRSSLSLTANGKSLNMNGRTTYDGSNFSISGTYSRGAMNSIGDGFYQLTISLDQVTAPGTYFCKPGTKSKLAYTQNLYGLGANNGTWNSQVGEGQAIVVVTEIDQSARTLVGSFAASLDPASSSTRGKQEIKGVFTARYSQ